MRDILWTTKMVEERFEEAVDTIRRLPPVKLKSYRTSWPEMVRVNYETDTASYRLLPPEPRAIERMDETMQWLNWVEPSERHLIWFRATKRSWKSTSRELNRGKTTLWRYWRHALAKIVSKLLVIENQTLKNSGTHGTN